MFGKKLCRRITFVMLFYVFSSPKCGYSLNIESTRKEAQKLENSRKKIFDSQLNKQTELSNQKNIQSDLIKSISGLEADITLIISSIHQLEREIESYNLKIEEIEQRKKEKEEFVSEKKNLLGKCFRLIYTHKVPSAYELLFETCDFEDFVDKIKLSKLVMDEFFRIADIVREEKAKIDNDLKEIQNFKECSQIKAREINENKKTLEIKKRNLEESYSNSKQTEKKVRKSIYDDEIEMRRIDREVERYKKQLEEERRKEEERRAKEQAKLSKNKDKVNRHRSKSVSLPLSPIIPNIVDGTLLWPVTGCNRITSGFYDREGRSSQHNALDITANRPGAIMGVPILAPAKMRITYAGWCGGYGNHVRGEFTLNGQTYEVRFGHLSYINVKTGDCVSAGHVVGNVGNTGYSTGAHLHFEIRKNSIPIDPASFKYIGRY